MMEAGVAFDWMMFSTFFLFYVSHYKTNGGILPVNGIEIAVPQQ